MPTLVTTQAIVLGRRPWSESSQIVSLVSRDLGRTRSVARGARKLTSELGPAIEPITESELVLAISPRSDLATIRSADVVEFFASLKRSLVRVALAGTLCELADCAMPEGEPNEIFYDHLRTALATIDAAEDATAVMELWRGIDALAGDLGYETQYAACVGCGSSETPHPAFSLADGGPVCANCHADFPYRWLPETEAMLRGLREGAAPTRIERRVNRDVRALFEAFFHFHVPDFERLRSLDILTAPTAGA